MTPYLISDCSPLSWLLAFSLLSPLDALLGLHQRSLSNLFCLKMGFERVFAGSKVDPGFYDVYEVEDVLDPVVLYVKLILNSEGRDLTLTNAY